MHLDHAVCVIRAGEIGMSDLIETSGKLKEKKRERRRKKEEDNGRR